MATSASRRHHSGSGLGKPESRDLRRYRAYVQKRLQPLLKVFARSSVGDFAGHVPTSPIDDEFSELYAGVEIMLQVINEQLGAVGKLNAELVERIQQLEQRESNLAALFQSIGDALVVTDGRGRINRVNPAFEALTGWKANKVYGRKITTVLPMERENSGPVHTAQRPFAIVARTKQPFVSRMGSTPAYFYIRRDGTKFPVSLTATPVLVGHRLIGFIEIFRDITQEKTIDTAKSEFVSLASHQLRTPLTVISWYAELMSEHPDGMNEKDRAYLNQIISAKRRMQRLVNDLLNVSRMELGTFMVKVGPYDLDKLIRDMLQGLRPLVDRKKIRLVVRSTGIRPRLNVDPEIFHLIAQNLVTNALSYTPRGGTVSVTLNLPRKRSATPADFMLRVHDSGIGIPQDEQRRIFSKFFRASNARRLIADGTGLGLYIVKSVLERVGGSITFTSRENRGTEFTVTLPRTGMVERSGTRKLQAPMPQS